LVAEKTLGYQESQLLNTGIGLRSLLHPDDLESFDNADIELAQTKDNQCVRFSYRLRHNDGYWLWFKSEEYVYSRDDAGKPIIVLGYATEFTEALNQHNELDEVNKVNQLLLNVRHKSTLQKRNLFTYWYLSGESERI
jgi:PAS domain-containing protein